MKRKKETVPAIIFACNEGGHFSQLLALSPLFSKYKSILVTDNARANKDIAALKYIFTIEYAMGFADRRKELIRSNKKITRIDYLKGYMKLLLESYTICRKYKPKVIISTGSNIAVPLFIWGKLMGSKVVYIETRAKVYTKTVTGKLVERFADKIYVQWPEMVKVYNGKAEFFGTLI